MAATSTIILLCFISSFIAIAQPFPSVTLEYEVPGSFQRAERIVLGIQNSYFILDADRNQILEFQDYRTLRKTMGGFGWALGSFDNPTGIATDGINVYVADYGNHRIQRFDRTFNPISSFSTHDTSDAMSRFGYPRDITLSEFGDLFILDGENCRVLKVNQFSKVERIFGDMQSGAGRLVDPFKMANANSFVYVGEKDRIVVFDYYGNYLKTLGQNIVQHLVGFSISNQYLLAASCDTLWWFLTDGTPISAVPKSYCITSEPMEDIQDVALTESMLYILTAKKVFIFKLSE